ncbi:MAG: tyrosine-type recombinase/integrase [Treponema sp.]|nr:tyrosine-type recombinase/integrase [Treponema sp.]
MKTKITMCNEQKKDITVKEAFEKYIKEKKIMNLSESTIKIYENFYNNPFIKFYSKNESCKNITKGTIIEFIDFIQKRNPNIKTTSINSYLQSLRAILYNFMENGYTPQFKIKLLKCEKTIKETYSPNELERLLKKPDIKKCRFSEYRSWVMVCYLLGTGNRLSTLCNLKIKDIDFENNEVALRKVKNKKQYIIPLSSTLSKTLSEYLKIRQGEPDDYLFCTQYGGRMEKLSVNSAIKRYNHSRGVAKTSVHLFRHTFAKNWILNGGDIFRLKNILGHSTLEMVKEYVNMFGGDLKRDFDKFNPLESMKASVVGREAINIRKTS